MRRPMERRRNTVAGFTLVELLVALALLTLMTVYAVAALRSLKDVSRVSTDMEAQSEIESVARHLRQVLSDARAVFVENDTDATELVFKGDAQRIELASVLNDRLERGGLYVLVYDAGEKGNALTLTRRLYRPLIAGSPPMAAERLLEGIEGVAFQYCEARCRRSPADWPPAWNQKDRLPGFIRISLKLPKGDSRRWPELIVPVAAAF